MVQNGTVFLGEKSYPAVFIFFLVFLSGQLFSYTFRVGRGHVWVCNGPAITSGYDRYCCNTVDQLSNLAISIHYNIYRSMIYVQYNFVLKIHSAAPPPTDDQCRYIYHIIEVGRDNNTTTHRERSLERKQKKQREKKKKSTRQQAAHLRFDIIIIIISVQLFSGRNPGVLCTPICQYCIII